MTHGIRRPLLSTCRTLAALALTACDPPDDAASGDTDASTSATATTTDVDTTAADPGEDAAKPAGPCDGPDADGCHVRSTIATQVVTGESFTCTRHLGGAVRCWGAGAALGNGSTTPLGDQPGELPVAPINLGGAAEELAAGRYHVCARLDTGTVRCWGYGMDGALGYPNSSPNVMPPPDVDVGAPVTQITAGSYHTCALLQDGRVRCWGGNFIGQLGVGHYQDLGDDPGELPPPDVMGLSNIIQIAAADWSTCALRLSGAVLCWGENYRGQLGLGHSDAIGGDPLVPLAPAHLPRIQRIAAGHEFYCALSNSNNVHCWGSNSSGQLGQGHTNNLGDNPGEMPPPAISLGGTPTKLGLTSHSACAILTDQKLKCWGSGGDGALGYANTASIGDNPGEMPPPAVSVGGSLTALSTGGLGRHRCSLDGAYNLRCWGYNQSGQLGYGHTNNIGDNEHPVSAGGVPY